MTIIAFDGIELCADNQVTGDTRNTSTIKIMPMDRIPVAVDVTQGKILAMTGCGDSGIIMRIRQLVEEICKDGKTTVTGAMETIRTLQVTPISDAVVIFLCKDTSDCPYLLCYDFCDTGEPFSTEDNCMFGVDGYIPTWFIKSDRFCSAAAVNFVSVHDEVCGRGYSAYHFEKEELTFFEKTDTGLAKSTQLDIKVCLEHEMEI